MNHMRERHLDGTVLMRQAGSAGNTVFESLQRPDLLITDAERANVITARRKDRDAALLGTVIFFSAQICLLTTMQIALPPHYLLAIPY